MRVQYTSTVRRRKKEGFKLFPFALCSQLFFFRLQKGGRMNQSLLSTTGARTVHGTSPGTILYYTALYCTALYGTLLTRLARLFRPPLSPTYCTNFVLYSYSYSTYARTKGSSIHVLYSFIGIGMKRSEPSRSIFE